MTVISRRSFRPLPGRSAEALSRVRRMGEILVKMGGRARVCAVAWGDGARDLHLYGVFADMQTGSRGFAAMMADPEALALRDQAESDPATVWEGPEIWRPVFGEPQPNFPVMLQREYYMDRRNLKHAIAMLPEVQALRPDRPVIGVMPIISSDMARVMVGYYATSLEDLGENIDKVGFSEAFQSIAARAAELGELKRARVVMNV